ncbi:hypothetical protein GCM10023149_14760 [Mucilaginibacter gynuensis]|uniref:L,D-TPase catalytic domain-containing protein n=1 Tax=Mucilaginibacter gynuensis TaxID=1302236 RepID=A0ABP8G4H3_9SPHI
MISYTNNKKGFLFLLAAMLFTLTFQSCKKSRSDMGKELAHITKNKVFKEVTPEGFAPVFEKALAEKKSTLGNQQLIASFYAGNDYDPVLIMEHLKNGDLKVLSDYLRRANEHGIKPETFQAVELKNLLDKIHDKKSIKTVNDAYETMAQLELAIANSLIKYSNAMQYGLVSPRKIYARYYTETKRPDSTSMLHALKVTALKNYLDSIQPKDPQYKLMQKALAEGITAPEISKEETQRYLIVSLERLRWKNKPTANKYVVVNIPDYRLDVMENGKSTLNMKVCVGEGRNMDNNNTLVEYDESDKVDRPFSRETPQLNSVINSVQVNPIWNIPQSIANKEIMVEAAQDPYYLSNKNIDVYKGGKKVDDPETIDWANASKSEYDFKQRPGDDNSLGKIKFLFKNSSSVYLHDTPAQLAFGQTMRAVSHGCVRLEKPQDLALSLFGEGNKYQTIAKDMKEDNPEPTNITLPNKTPVYLTYITCWPAADGTLQFRPDVYGLDVVLYAHMKKMLAV